ncbi:hypothetical protein D3C81_1608130 [compost metagenome]
MILLFAVSLENRVNFYDIDNKGKNVFSKSKLISKNYKGGRSLGFALRVEGLDSGECIELEEETLISIEYHHRTVDFTKARSMNMEYVLNIG